MQSKPQGFDRSKLKMTGELSKSHLAQRDPQVQQEFRSDTDDAQRLPHDCLELCWV